MDIDIVSVCKDHTMSYEKVYFHVVYPVLPQKTCDFVCNAQA